MMNSSHANAAQAAARTFNSDGLPGHILEPRLIGQRTNELVPVAAVSQIVLSAQQVSDLPTPTLQ